MGGGKFNKTGTDQKEYTLLFVYSEAAESKLVKLETSSTVIGTSSRVSAFSLRYLH